MMTAQQQNAVRIKTYTYSHEAPAVDVASSSSSAITGAADHTAEMSGGTSASTSSTTSLPDVDRKRKRPSSPTDNTGANGNADTPNKEKEQHPSKKSRRELPPHTVAILKGWMLSREHVKHPYPTDEDKQMLLKKTGISMKQLTNWFTNARKRIWKPMMRREHSRQMQSAMEFNHTAVREFPGAGRSQQYAESSYASRPSVRHSFDAGSLSALPHATAGTFDRYARPQAVPVNASMYATSAVRSLSETRARTDVDNYIDAERTRERILERDQDGHTSRNLSPPEYKIVQERVTANARRGYPNPSNSERLQIARDTELDVAQVDGWMTNVRGQTGVASAHTTSVSPAGNSMLPPPPVFGERRSIPTHGNPMFPPRSTASGSFQPSIPSMGNLQFPSPPARREASDSYFAGFLSNALHHPGHEATRMRSMTASSSPYVPPPFSSAGNDSQAQNASNSLPSLANRNLVSRPPPIVISSGPTMGQPRDSRSRTLDMGQFADARRRKMTFQDILASTRGATASSAAAAATSSAMLQSTGLPVASGNMENVYHTSDFSATTVYPATASSVSQQKYRSVQSEQQSDRIV